ncbi:ABC-type uncharacterized transport system permease subunit [Bradyrhizobium sp. LM3.2]
MELVEAIILAVLAASTPLLIAATGELVTERSGVLNLGVEGMMIVGAACGFAGAWLTGSIFIGALFGIVAGTMMSLVFALMALGLAVNQVATGLALTILGVGLSGLIGAGFVGERITPAVHLYVPGLTDIPLIGRVLFGEDAFIYFSLALVVGVWWFLYRTRPGLILRACGDNHVSAHALGYPVLRIRTFAVMFGGACAGLAGAYLPLAYTPFFIPGMTAGRGWIALVAGGVLVLAARPTRGRRLPVRGGDDPATARAGLGRRHSLAVHVGAALPCDRHRAGPALPRAHRRIDRAGRARHRVRAGSLAFHFCCVRDGARTLRIVAFP